MNLFRAARHLCLGFVATLCALGAPRPASATAITPVFVFHGNPDVAVPNGGLTLGPDGALYGTAFFGGVPGAGELFRTTLSGTTTLVHSFAGGGDGYFPASRPIFGTDGHMYGVAAYGGTSSGGTFYTCTTTGDYQVLHSFQNSTEGSVPIGAPVQGSDSSFYGTVLTGGVNGGGCLYRITSAGVFTVLHSFSGGAEGGSPRGDLLLAKDGSLYGVCGSGGVAGYGTVWKSDLAGHITTLHGFIGGGDTAEPELGLFEAKDGTLYGTTRYHGVYQIKAGIYTLLHVFTHDEGYYPQRFMQTADGALYAVCHGGGAKECGTFVRLNPDHTVTVLSTFSPETGSLPTNMIVQGADGGIYASASHGGAEYHGAIDRLTTAGALTMIHAFGGSADGEALRPNLLRLSDGSYYGSTQNGGAFREGMIFRVTPSGVMTSLHAFSYAPFDAYNQEGALPNQLMRATDGNLYGTCAAGGLSYTGTLFRITTSGAFTLLHRFNSADGSQPVGELVQVGGLLYGATMVGGAHGHGVIFSADTTGRIRVVYSFTGGRDGANPGAGLCIAANGYLYGTTQTAGDKSNGTLFRIKPDGTGFSVLHVFAGAPTDGAMPMAEIMQTRDGSLFGTTWSGGQNGLGTIYQIAPNGVYSVAHVNAGVQQSNMAAKLTEGTDGLLYGGYYWSSVVFSFNRANGRVVPISVFDNGIAYKALDVTEDSNGNFFGCSEHGGGGPNGLATGVIYTIRTLLPIITSFSPGSGKVGTVVTVTGKNISSIVSVTFNGVRAAFSSVSSVKFTAVVPAGAKTGPIVVQTFRGSFTSRTNFVVN